MNAFEAVYFIILGMALGGYVIWGILEFWVVKPMQKELLSVLRDNCVALQNLVERLGGNNSPAFVEDPDEEEEEDHCYLPDPIEQEQQSALPAGHLIPILPDFVVSQYNFAGTQTNFEVHPHKPQ